MLSQSLKQIVERYSRSGQHVLKTHLLPPDPGFLGKAIFIYSNPDKSVESVFYAVNKDPVWGKTHFKHLEGADKEWSTSLEEINLFSRDVLGLTNQLERWLLTGTVASNPQDANILVVKYEQLWEKATIKAMEQFLSLPIKLPKKRERGKYERPEKQKKIQTAWNKGSEKNPRYEAYDQARDIWANSPAFQFRRV